jgi:hypothetical protein
VTAINSIQDFGHCRSPRAVSPNTPQLEGTPTPWPKSDGRLSELGLNTGISWKSRVMVTDASALTLDAVKAA